MNKIKRGIDLIAFKVSQRLNGAEVSASPWFDDETLAWFTDRLPRTKSYLEFGSGGSTVMAARMGIPTISVEGDHFFAGEVAKKIGTGHKVQLLRPPIGMTGLWGVPIPGSPTPGRVKKWRSYIDLPFRVLEQSGQEFPDLFLVDGRFRTACALRAALETKRAGRHAELLFDDYERVNTNNYHKAEEILGAPTRIGRSAVFKLGPDNAVTTTDIDVAMQDFH